MHRGFLGPLQRASEQDGVILKDNEKMETGALPQIAPRGPLPTARLLFNTKVT